MHLIIEKEGTLIEALSMLSPNSSKTTLRSWIKEERVSVDGRIIKQHNALVVKGQKIELGAKTRFINNQIRIIYEDNDLVAIDKPNGLLSVATAFEKGDTAHGMLKEHYHPRRVHVVHRIDQDTSGVMLYALSDEAYHKLKILFEKHDIERSYCAILEGDLKPPKGTWQSYLYEDSLYKVHSTDDPEKGRLAITHYATKKNSSKYTCVDLTLETGRKNQIRVHCADHGHPVVGDKKYGATSDPLKRLCLHAQLIAFIHPITQKEMRFVSPPPPIFDQLVNRRG